MSHQDWQTVPHSPAPRLLTILLTAMCGFFSKVILGSRMDAAAPAIMYTFQRIGREGDKGRMSPFKATFFVSFSLARTQSPLTRKSNQFLAGQSCTQLKMEEPIIERRYCWTTYSLCHIPELNLCNQVEGELDSYQLCITQSRDLPGG